MVLQIIYGLNPFSGNKQSMRVYSPPQNVIAFPIVNIF